MLVLGVIMIAGAMVAGLYIMLRTRVDDLTIASDRVKGQFLCEAGASVALVDFRYGRIGSGPGQWLDRTFNFPVGTTIHRLTYKFRKVSGNWEVTSSVASPGGLGSTYTLRLGGKRAVPFFIWGMGAGL